MSSSIPQNSVLVVDDMEGIRVLVSRILSELGYQVIAAATGLEALEQAQKVELHAAVVDLTMPAMDGITLTNKLRELQPQLPVVLMSGFDMDNVLASQPKISPPPGYLEKPFRIAQLLDALTEAVDQSKC